MKKISFVLMALPFVFACNNGSKDSVEKADSANEAKIDTTLANDTTTSAKTMIGVDATTSDFMVKVADVGMTEVKLGGIAQDKASSKRVKDFGEMMTKDHSKAGEELKSLAGRKKVTLPETIGEDHQKKIDDLTDALKNAPDTKDMKLTRGTVNILVENPPRYLEQVMQ